MLARTQRVADYLRVNRIDLLHCHLPIAGIVGRLAAARVGVPVVYTEHSKPEWYLKPTFWLNAWTYGLQQQVVAVSASVEQSIHRYIGRRVPVTVVRNGIDPSCFRRNSRDGRVVRKLFEIPQDAVVVGTVAALIGQKRVHDWVDTARMIHARHPNTRFLLVGEGPQRAALQRHITAGGLQNAVFLCGGHADVRPYLAAMDIYMVSSACEGLPVALLEAMAMECAPVCTAAGGIAEVIQEGRNGFLTECGRNDQLAEKVVHLLDDPDKRRAVSAMARRTVENHFRVERMTRELEAIYFAVLRSSLSNQSISAYQRVAPSLGAKLVRTGQ